MLWALFVLTVIWSLLCVYEALVYASAYLQVDLSNYGPCTQKVFKEYHKHWARKFLAQAVLIVLLNIYIGVSLLWIL
jgi:hypothetical protein